VCPHLKNAEQFTRWLSQGLSSAQLSELKQLKDEVDAKLAEMQALPTLANAPPLNTIGCNRV